MFVQRSFRSARPDFADGVLSASPWGLLVTTVDGTITASHLPFVFEPDTEPNGVLLGHMNRANPQWRHLAPDREVLVVVEGPGAYVSPAIYEVTPAAPSFNYVAVHAYGRPRLIEDPEETFALLLATVARFERGPGGRDWDVEPSLEYARRIAGGVAAFRIELTRVDAAAKLSQNKPPQLQDRVQRAFAASTDQAARDLAVEMARERDARAMTRPS